MSMLQVYIPSSNPFNHQWLSALVAVIPILCMLVTLGMLRWKAHNAGLLSWAFAFIVAITAYRMPFATAAASSAQGFVYGLFPIVWILLGAIWMYQVTVISGRFDDLRRTFFLISDDPRVLGLLIAFCFGGLLEALAGFGAPVAIAAAMLIAVGFSKVRAAVTALLANTVPVAFGAVGLPVAQAAQGAGLPVLAVSPITGRLTAIMCLFVPILLLLVMDGKKGVKECWPFGLFVGLIFGIVKVIVSRTALYGLTEIFAAVITVALAIAFTRVWHPKGSVEALASVGVRLDPAIEGDPVPSLVAASAEGGSSAAEKVKSVSLVAEKTGTSDMTSDLTPSRIAMAIVPYLLVIVVFALANTSAIRAMLKHLDVTFAWPGLSGLMGASGGPAAHQFYTLTLGSSPGTLLFIVAILVGIIYQVPAGKLFGELWTNVKKMRFAMLTIGLVVALAYVMGDSGQTLALGMFIAGVGAIYPFLAPVLGWLGTYVTGSDTSSNVLFAGLQSTVGQHIGTTSALGVDRMRALLVGANAAGGVVGKMISPQSLTIAATAIGLAGGESDILRRMVKWCVILLALLCLLAGLASTPVLSWILP